MPGSMNQENHLQGIVLDTKNHLLPNTTSRFQ